VERREWRRERLRFGEEQGIVGCIVLVVLVVVVVVVVVALLLLLLCC